MTTVVIYWRAVSCARFNCVTPKPSLSAVVDEAMHGKPAVITRHGKRQAVVVGYKEWERLLAS
jgi:prevent-host-death family protein